MPRNGSNIYTYPAGTEGFPDTTIESAKYNSYILDVQEDLNRPRPIVAGGTGANDADEALANLGAEKASQKVLNYNSHVFYPGSFYSVIGATGAPPAPAGQTATHAFVGWVVSSDPPATPPTSQNVVVYARNQNDTVMPPRTYVREKKAGVWGLWGIEAINLVVADTPPAGVPTNTLWWDSTDGLLYVLYADADSQQWVLTSPLPKPPNALAIVADTPPEGVPNNSLWWNNTDGLLYILYADADSQQWVLASPLPQADVTLAGIAAAPFAGGMAYSGIQINGGMNVSQELGTSALTNAGFVVDGWHVGRAGTMAVSTAQVLDAPPGFLNSIKLTVTTAKATLAVNEETGIFTVIEGYRVLRLAFGTASAQSISLGFWTKIHRTGMYSGTVANGAASRTYAFTYTQNVADAWEYKTVTIPGDVTGTWLKNTNAGLVVSFAVACHSGLCVLPGSWLGSSGSGAIGTTNGVATTSDTFQITGVTVFPGNQAPTAAQSANTMRPYDQELVTCKRYYQKYPNILVETAALYHSVALPVEMRITPVITGGGAGFASANTTTATLNCSQTTRALQTIVLDARL